MRDFVGYVCKTFERDVVVHEPQTLPGPADVNSRPRTAK